MSRSFFRYFKLLLFLACIEFGECNEELVMGEHLIAVDLDSQEDSLQGALSLAWESLYYSEGAFMEGRLLKKKPLTERLNLIAQGTVGMNQGYITQGHDGFNHVALLLAFDYALSDSINLLNHYTYNLGVNKETSLAGDEQLRDLLSL